MPCNTREEELAQVRVPSSRRQSGKGAKRGADHELSDDEEMNSRSELTDEQSVERTGPGRKCVGKADFTLIKCWVTGDRAEMEQEDIERELYELARDFMEASGIKKLPSHTHNENDLGLWKLNKVFIRRKSGQKIKVYRCPMNYRCGCEARIRIIIGHDFIQLERHGVHDVNSHVEDRSKFLKHDQIIAVSEAVTIAPNLSAAILRRNLQMLDGPGSDIGADLLRSIRYRVKSSREKLATSQLEGHFIDGSFGSLTRFANRINFSSLIDKHNDPTDEYHMDIFAPVVIGSDIKARHDVVHLNITSPWFLCNIFRSYMSGWSTQLNGDNTFGFCRSAVDMIGLGVNSIGGHNNPLTWSIIPKGSEGSITYDLTFEETQAAAIEMFERITSCSDCALCKTLDVIRAHPDVVKYTKSTKYRDAKLHIDSAQCDNHLGWQKFAREQLGLSANICKNHVLGEPPAFKSHIPCDLV